MDCGSRRIIASGRRGRMAGDPAKAREHADAGRLLYDPEKHASHRLVYGGHDPGVCAGYIGAQAEWLLGYPEKALASITESLALAERIAHPFTLSVALTISSVVYLNRREPEQALRQLEAAEALVCGATALVPLRAWHAARRGFARTRCRRRSNRPRSRGRNELDPARAHYLFALWFGVPGRGFGPARRSDGGTGRITGGIGNSGATGEHVWDAELHRLTGTVLLAENKLDEGQASLQQAIRIAQAQQAKSLELRAATSLARLWGEQGRRAEARDLLAPVYGWFTEGFDTADLKEAKALLDELTPHSKKGEEKNPDPPPPKSVPSSVPPAESNRGRP